MGAIVRRVQRTAQPVGPVRVDPSLGLQAAFVGGRDVLRSGAQLLDAGASVSASGVSGREVFANTEVYKPLGVPVGSSWTVLMLCTADVLLSPFSYFLGWSGANPAALALSLGSIGNRCGLYDGAAVLDSGLTVPSFKEFALGVTFDGSSNSYRFFLNGRAGDVRTGANLGAKGQWQWRTVFDNPNTLAFSLLAFSSACVPPERMLELTSNPWSIFEPERRSIIVPASSNAPALSNFWANVGGVPTRTLGPRVWDGTQVVTPIARRWDGAAWVLA